MLLERSNDPIYAFTPQNPVMVGSSTDGNGPGIELTYQDDLFGPENKF